MVFWNKNTGSSDVFTILGAWYKKCGGMTWYGSFEGAKKRCVGTKGCEWLHDTNCDGKNPGWEPMYMHSRGARTYPRPRIPNPRI